MEIYVENELKTPNQNSDKAIKGFQKESRKLQGIFTAIIAD